MIKLKDILSESFQKRHFLNLIKQEVDSLKGQVAYAKDKVNYKGTPDWEKKEFKGVLKDLLKKLKDTEKHYKRVQKLKEGKLTEGKFKMKGKYLYMPGGEVSSIPKRRERERILVQIKNEKFQIYDNGFDEFHIIGSRNDYYPKGKKDLERFLNKNKAKYIGIDR